jgi:hypothetical protein
MIKKGQQTHLKKKKKEKKRRITPKLPGEQYSLLDAGVHLKNSPTYKGLSNEFIREVSMKPTLFFVSITFVFREESYNLFLFHFSTKC